ncbi:RNA polymerase II-associated protein 1 [Latimeria chalumnae]|uniref:RNA polymerase II-associated protein 1 n=1 Tax=Latimeria chalumnae TaxID=7897 RepID=UPI00313DF9E6
MLARPKPGESEEDLLHFQNQFLAAGKSPAVKIVKKADKRKVETGGEEEKKTQDKRDVVVIEDFPDLPPILTPAPLKRSKSERVRFEDEDPAEQLDRHDKHITAVFSKIVERDTSMAPVSLPFSSGTAFPKVFHRSEVKSEATPVSGKRSIFAQKIAAQRAAAGNQVAPKPSEIDSPATDNASPLHAFRTERTSEPGRESEGQGLSRNIASRKGSQIVTGAGLGMPDWEKEAQKIHEENLERLCALSEEQILEERKKLLAQLDPTLVAFLKSKKTGTCPIEEQEMELTEQTLDAQVDTITPDLEIRTLPKIAKAIPSPSARKQESPNLETVSEREDEEREPATQTEITVADLPVKPEKEWLHMDSVEQEKLEWMKDLPTPKLKRTKKVMQARFSLKGELIPPDTDIPTYHGLHHHGEEPEQAGYSLQELFHLSRSHVIQQRTLSLQILAHIVQKAKDGEFASSLRGSLLRVLLDAGFLFLLRFSLDDTVDNVIAASVHALRALLVCPADEDYLDQTFSWFLGAMSFPLLPNEVDEKEDDDDDEEEEEEENNTGKVKEGKKSTEEKKPDPDVARVDVIKGLLKMKLLHRLRYILEVVRPVAAVVVDILNILTRMARHSSEACSQIMECPRLMETIVSQFLPSTWKPQPIQQGQVLNSVHGVPVSSAMKLVRVLASGGRNMAAMLLNKYGLKEQISRFVAEEPQDLPLETREAFLLSTESLRLWAVAAAYGQACDLYRDLYPVLMRILQSLPGLVSQQRRGDPGYVLSLKRAEALTTLLSNITQTAGCAIQLQAAFICSDEREHIPPPLVNWSHVAGLKPFLECCLKRMLKETATLESHGPTYQLSAAILIYLGAYYSQLGQQRSFQPVDCLEELEELTAEVLLPLLSQPALHSMWENLRYCSALCNPNSCASGPESIPSLVSLGCARGKLLPLSLVGEQSPFPFLTALLYLINIISTMHKGIVGKFSLVLNSKSLGDYLLQSCKGTPVLNHASAWLLRHEYHFQYFLLKLATKMVKTCAEVSQQALTYHDVALVLLGKVLPGSEHLAQDLLSSLVFSQDFMPEGKAGGPEAEDLSQLLHLGERNPAPPASAAEFSSTPSRGTLLQEAYQHLPSISHCYLAHFAHFDSAVLRSRALYGGQTHLVQSALLPEMKGPILPADWPFLPLINLYDRVTKAELKGKAVTSLPPNLVELVTNSLKWVLLLEVWRSRLLQGLPLAAKLARLACVFLTGSDLFLEAPVHCYTAALLSIYCQPKVLDSLDLDAPLPGLTSFYDLYTSLLEQFEGVSFGDPLFGCFVLLPLQRKFSVQFRLAVFGEHVSLLRALGVPLKQFIIPLERYTSPPEDSLELLRYYFKSLVTGTLRQSWCPILYTVALSHVNSFIFSQGNVEAAVDTARRNMLKKTYLLTDEVLRKHLLFFKLPNVESQYGFEMYEELPPLRQKWLQAVCGEMKTSREDRRH